MPHTDTVPDTTRAHAARIALALGRHRRSGGVERSTKEIQAEIRAIIRQITASVTFLPLLDEPCTFDLLVYTDAESEVPRTWEESDPKYIADSEEVRLRSFTTKVHKVDAMVAYKKGDDYDV